MKMMARKILEKIDKKHKKGNKKTRLKAFIASFLEEEMHQNGFEVWVNGAWYRIRNGVIACFGFDEQGIKMDVQPIYCSFHYLDKFEHGSCTTTSGRTADTPQEVLDQLDWALTEYFLSYDSEQQTEKEQHLQQLLISYWFEYAKPFFDRCIDVDSMSYALDETAENRYKTIQECDECSQDMITLKQIPHDDWRKISVNYRLMGEVGFVIESARLKRWEDGIAWLKRRIERTNPDHMPERITQYKEYIAVLEERNVDYLNEATRRMVERNLAVIKEKWPVDMLYLLPDAEQLAIELRLQMVTV